MSEIRTTVGVVSVEREQGWARVGAAWFKAWFKADLVSPSRYKGVANAPAGQVLAGSFLEPGPRPLSKHAHCACAV